MNEKAPLSQQLPEESIDSLGHILTESTRDGDDELRNTKIDVFREGEDRGQIYQMWAVDKFAANPIALEAAEKFSLAGESDEKTKWTQLVEHISGVTAIAEHLENTLEKYGATPIDHGDMHTASLVDSLQKPEALEVASLVHDIEKPAELAATGGGGLENSRDNPVLRDGKLWRWLHEKGVDDDTIMAAQNTGRSDRFFSDLDDYDDDAVKKALADREALAELIGADRDVVDDMTPTERRRTSIEAKGRTAAIVGIADALASQFRFRGMTEDGIDAMSAHYLTYKKDPESVSFFGQDWPEYYKEVKKYLVDQVPSENRGDLAAELDNLTHEKIFNETVLPHVLGEQTMQRASNGDESARQLYEALSYPEA